jgi:hypothetical protein
MALRYSLSDRRPTVAFGAKRAFKNGVQHGYAPKAPNGYATEFKWCLGLEATYAELQCASESKIRFRGKAKIPGFRSLTSFVANDPKADSGVCVHAYLGGQIRVSTPFRPRPVVEAHASLSGDL